MPIAALILSFSVLAQAAPAPGLVAEQLGSIHNTRSARQVYDGGNAAPAAAIRLGSRRPGTGTTPSVTADYPGAHTRRGVVRPVPGVGSAHALKLPPGTYGAAPPPHLGWDYNRMVFAAGIAAGGALLGFMLGGPIGAAVGFLAGFFIGALIGKATGVGS